MNNANTMRLLIFGVIYTFLSSYSFPWLLRYLLIPFFMEDMTSLCQLKEYMPTCGFNNRKQKRKQSQGATRTVKKNAKMKMEQQTQRNRTVKLFERTNGSFDFTASLFCEGMGIERLSSKMAGSFDKKYWARVGESKEPLYARKQANFNCNRGGVGP